MYYIYVTFNNSLDEIQIMCDKVPCVMFWNSYFILFNLPISDFSLKLRYFVCASLFRFLSIMTPRNSVKGEKYIKQNFL